MRNMTKETKENHIIHSNHSRQERQERMTDRERSQGESSEYLVNNKMDMEMEAFMNYHTRKRWKRRKTFVFPSVWNLIQQMSLLVVVVLLVTARRVQLMETGSGEQRKCLQFPFYILLYTRMSSISLCDNILDGHSFTFPLFGSISIQVRSHQVIFSPLLL